MNFVLFVEAQHEGIVSRTGEKKGGGFAPAPVAAAPNRHDATKRVVSPWREMASTRR